MTRALSAVPLPSRPAPVALYRWSCRTLRKVPLGFSYEVPVSSISDQPGCGECLEGGGHFRRGGPRVRLDAPPWSVPELLHLRLRQILEPSMGGQGMAVCSPKR